MASKQQAATKPTVDEIDSHVTGLAEAQGLDLHGRGQLRPGLPRGGFQARSHGYLSKLADCLHARTQACTIRQTQQTPAYACT